MGYKQTDWTSPFAGTGILFIDTETTGLDPGRHEIWNMALIDCSTDPVRQYEWFWQPSHLETADPGALRLNNFYDHFKNRRSLFSIPEPSAPNIAALTAGKKLAGMNPAFDQAFLTKLLNRFSLVPAWDYHLVDVEAAMVGYLADVSWLDDWSSSKLGRAVGVPPEAYDRHTAIGDALWAHDCLASVMGLDYLLPGDRER